MRYKNFLVFAILGVAFNHLQAQNVGIGTNSPAASAQLQISSNNKGLLIPLVSLDSLKDVTTVSSPARRPGSCPHEPEFNIMKMVREDTNQGKGHSPADLKSPR